MEYHLAPTFVGVDAGGKVLDRTAWMEYWKSTQPQEVIVGEIETRPAGAAVVVTLVLHLSGPTSGTAAGNQAYRVLSVWQQVKGGWTLTATSVTPMTSQ